MIFLTEKIYNRSYTLGAGIFGDIIEFFLPNGEKVNLLNNSSTELWNFGAIIKHFICQNSLFLNSYEY